MVRKMLRAGLFAALGMIAMLASYGVANTAEDKVPDISTIMQKSFKGKDSLKASITADVKAEKWEDAQKLAKEWSELGAALGKNKAPKGDPKSWDELSKKFADNTKAVSDAVEKKDGKAATAAIGAIGSSCGACHKAHKP